MAWIYGIVNTITNELEYVGQTKGTVASRFASHRNGTIPMDRHMREVGVRNFTIVKLKECYEHELNALEKTYIKTLQPKYNVTYKVWSKLSQESFLITENGHWCPKIIPQVPSQCQEKKRKKLKKFNKNPETREKIFIKFSVFSLKNLLQFK